MSRLPLRPSGLIQRTTIHRPIRPLTTMATATTVQLGPDITPQYPPATAAGPFAPSSQRASSLLQENHDQHHIFFNDSGFHNHVAHHLLSLWALHASPEELQRQYDVNKSMQRPSGRPDASAAASLHDPQKFLAHLGPGSHYQDFLSFFTSQIDALGWREVLKRFVFARGDPVAETMFVRLHAGFLHPIIHLGFGVEFAQPAIIAEALAETACHDDWIGGVLVPAEERAAEERGKGGRPAGFADLLDEARGDAKLAGSAAWGDDNKVRDGVMVRAREEMIALAARVRVREGGVERAVAEMTDAVAWYSAGAQRRDRIVKFDFYFIHCLNSSIFYPAFLRQDWLSEADKVRLVEWKVRMDITMYVSRNSPEVLWEEVVRNYRPKRPSGWDGIERRVCGLDDDGHAVKLVRALANGEAICRPYEGEEGFRLKREDWLNLGHMAIDSVEAPGQTWVRSAGFDEAWQDVPAKL